MGINILYSDLTQAIANNAQNMAEYVGEANPGTAKAATGWRIKKIVYDANNAVTDVLWAEGSNAFDKVWNDYATYSYS